MRPGLPRRLVALLSAAAVLLVSCGEAPQPKDAVAVAPTVSAEAPAPLRSATVSSAAPTPSPSASAGEACTPACIPGTSIPGTDENRTIIAFCEIYRHALEAGDVETLVAIASPSYREDAGTTDTADDLDRAGLEKFLRAQMSAVSAMRAEFLYRSVDLDGEVIVVTYTYAASYRLNGEWRRTVDDNELRLARSGDSFVILSGM